jgi:hypothetical protein
MNGNMLETILPLRFCSPWVANQLTTWGRRPFSPSISQIVLHWRVAAEKPEDGEGLDTLKWQYGGPWWREQERWRGNFGVMGFSNVNTFSCRKITRYR